VVSESEAKNVIAYGPGLQPEMVREGVPAKFTVDTSKCAKAAQLDVRLSTDKGQAQKPQIKSKGDGLYEVTYQPPPAGSNVLVGVTYDGEDINGSPYKVKVLPTVEPSKVTLSGPGVSPVCTASFPTDFVVDTSNAGYGDLEVQVVVSSIFTKYFVSVYRAFDILYLHIQSGDKKGTIYFLKNSLLKKKIIIIDMKI